MCKKDYNEHMAKSLKVVSLRFDYFSMPNFKDEFVTLLKNMFKGNTRFVEKLLGETDMSLIDTDTVAYNLDTTIEDVTSRKCYVFEVIFDDCLMTVYIHPMFLFVNFQNSVIAKVNEYFNLIRNLVNQPQFKDNVNLFNITLTISNEIYCQRTEILSYIDRDAFPTIDFIDTEYKGGRYAEQLKKKVCSIILIRNISFDENDDAHIDIQAQASPDDLNLDRLSETTHSMLEESLKEIAKCLK